MSGIAVSLPFSLVSIRGGTIARLQFVKINVSLAGVKNQMYAAAFVNKADDIFRRVSKLPPIVN